MKSSLLASLVTILCICAAIFFHTSQKKKNIRAQGIFKPLQIKEDKGIMDRLPSFENIELDNHASNVCRVFVNNENQISFNEEQIQLEELQARIIEFISNTKQQKDLPENQKKAIVSLQNDVSTSYEIYLDVYNEISNAYHVLWNNKSEEIYRLPWEALPEAQRKEIKKEFPFAISEAEPTKLNE